MAEIKISAKVEAAHWQALREIARESHQTLSSLLTEAISDFVQKWSLRLAALDHLEDSMAENEALGRRLAK